jgi:hypothetical protein
MICCDKCRDASKEAKRRTVGVSGGGGNNFVVDLCDSCACDVRCDILDLLHKFEPCKAVEDARDERDSSERQGSQ